MSLIVDVLKRAQRNAAAKGSLPPFIKYPHDEGLPLSALVSKHIWLFRLAIGLTVVIILTVSTMTLQGRQSVPTKAFSHKATGPSQEFSVASPEPGDKSQEEGLNRLNDQLGQIFTQMGHAGVKSGKQMKLEADATALQKAVPQYPDLDLEDYTVKSGDSLTKVMKGRYNIAQKDLYNEYLQLIKRLNPSLEDLDTIYPGQTLTLPIYSPQIARMPLQTTLPPPEPEYKPQKEKTPATEPEKKITTPSAKGKKVRPGNINSPSRKILLEERPSHDIRYHFDLAVSYQKLGEKAKALEEYRKVIEIDPMNVEAHNNLGVIYKDMGRLKEAVKEFQTVLSRDPKQENARNNLGIIFYLQGNLEKAIQELRGVLDINPRNREAYINLGVIYKRRNRMGEAKRMFENAVSIDPYCPEAYYNLGLIFEQKGDIKEAISHYQKFIDFSGGAYHELAAKVKRHLKTLYQSGG